MGHIVEARGLGWRHSSRIEPALEGIDLVISRGQKVLLTGHSGAGKSTLLSAIAGLLGEEDDGESTGTLIIDGTVGMVLQDPDSQVIASRIGDDVAFGCENLSVPREEIWPRVRRALTLVGLDLPLDHPTRHLSGGQKQRLALAGVIAMGAELILLDEPTANLDPQGQREVVEALTTVVEETGATLLIAEHRPALWADLADRFLHLDAEGLQEISREQLPTPPILPPARGVAPGTPSLLSARELLTQWGPPRTFDLPEGASIVITGPNGSGKSTLAWTLAGLLAPQGGDLHMADSLRQGLKTPSHRWSSRQLVQRIGFVFQDPEHQFVARTVAEEMAISGGSPERVEELLSRLRLEHLKEANPFTLSGGEKRRLSVATVLMTTPTLLVLDEPTFGQDTTTFVELVGLIRELNDQGVTVVSITHDALYIASLGDHEVALS